MPARAENPSAQAAERVVAIRDDPAGRYALAAAFYARRPPAVRAYSRAQLSYLRWTIARGALASAAAPVPGSAWWRAVNERLLSDMTEAALRRTDDGARASVRRWVEFLTAPSPSAWYRAHNASVVAGYLEHESLAAREPAVERFMINVALLRVLYAHALVAAPRLALGRLAPLGRALGDPRGGSVDAFLNLGRVFPQRYPIGDLTVSELLAREHRLGRLLDYGVIAPRFTALYAFAAASLEEPGLGELQRDGFPCYAWPASETAPWRQGAVHPLPRLLARATRPVA